jgi:hypothetical protein
MQPSPIAETVSPLLPNCRLFMGFPSPNIQWRVPECRWPPCSLSLFGIVILTDLRALDVVLTRVPAAEITADLRPWMTAGVVVMIASGMLMFLNAPVDYYNSSVFRIKMLMLLLAAANALVLRAVGSQSAPHGRIVAFRRSVSLLLWAGIIVAGRMITYSLLGVQ